eukprot:CAMPEP_0170170954 /NCGR_PEP_ID=MMETSP0040_2-20121228/3996_1 /TAXON_ID=641309 /ORGANISM="Lotharella oceanica, Strain CCMP622" /LENGTH=195 /DNA_ID=CAMNT_0010410689 /DNA_START=29 /DNA_END=616 /DNA_ORIENTATION=-
MESVKCVTVGDGCVGKTCLLVSYTTNSFPTDHIPTIFDNHSTNMMMDNKVVNLGLWDTAGQEDYDRLRPLAYPLTDVFLVVYSVDSETSLKNVWQKWAPEIRHHCKEASIILIGNKCDLREDEKYNAFLRARGKKLVSKDAASEVAKVIGAEAHFETSALTQENLKETFDSAVRLVLKQRDSAMKKRKKRACTII